MTRWRALGLGAAGLLAFLGLWEGAVQLGWLNARLTPPPSVVPAAFLKEFNGGHWLTAVGRSLSHYAFGLSVGAVLGIAAGGVIGLSAWAEAAASWIVRALRPIPGVAWIPFAIIWFGVSEQAAAFIIAMGVFWINFLATLGAVKGVDRDLLEVAAAFGQGGFWARARKVAFPAAAPGVLTGLRISMGQAWMSVVAAELFGVPGLGARMMEASSLLASPVVLVYMLSIAVLYGVVDAVFGAFSDWALRWTR